MSNPKFPLLNNKDKTYSVSNLTFYDLKEAQEFYYAINMAYLDGWTSGNLNMKQKILSYLNESFEGIVKNKIQDFTIESAIRLVFAIVTQITSMKPSKPE